MVPIDEQHRIVAEYRGACGQFFPEGKYIDAQAAMSRAIHAVLDMMLGHARVSGLDEHVREAAYFAIGCAAMVFVLFTSRTVLNATWPGFASIQPHHKQLYTLMNLLKSALLGLQATSFSWLWYSSKEYLCTLNPLGFDYSCDWSVDTGHQAFVKQISLLYAAVDVVALLVVPKLPLTTKIHHWAVAAWLVWVMTIDLSASPIAQKLMFYGFWSTLAFPVNAFLGLRVTSPGAKWMAGVAKFCFVLYVACCACNWSLHLLWGVDCLANGTLRWQDVLYLASLSFLVNDDLILMKWLKNFKPMSPEALKKKAQEMDAKMAKST